MNLIKNFINFILLPFIIGWVLYQAQILYESTTKQIEYSEQINRNIQIYIERKFEYDTLILNELINIFSKYQKLQLRLINEKQNINEFKKEYIKEVSSLNSENFSLEYSKILYEKKIKLDFIKEELLNNFIYLKIFSNKQYYNLESNILKLIDNSESMTKSFQNHILINIKKISNLDYIFDNIHSIEDLKINLLEFINQNSEMQKQLKDLQVESEKINIKLNIEKELLLKDIHQKVNGNFFVNIVNKIFEKKIIIFPISK